MAQPTLLDILSKPVILTIQYIHTLVELGFKSPTVPQR